MLDYMDFLCPNSMYLVENTIVSTNNNYFTD